MKSNWKEKSTLGKVMLVARLLASVGVIVFALLCLLEIWNKAINVSVPLMGVVLVLQSIQEWKKHRGIAILGLCTALFIFSCAIVVWFF